jgi:hypothetical protein
MVLAQQPRPWDRALFLPDTAQDHVFAVDLLAQLLQVLHKLRLKPTVGEFLDAVRQAAFEKAPIIWWRLLAKEASPLILQIVDI